VAVAATGWHGVASAGPTVTRARHEHRLPPGGLCPHTAIPPETSGGFVMPDPNVALIRHAYAAYARGDTVAMLDLVDPDLSGPTSIPAPPTRAHRSATVAASWQPHSPSRPNAACVPSWRR
jgi:hypothetical protein